MNAVSSEIWILDSSLNKVTRIPTPYPLDKSGTILRYSKELDDFGQCTFRVHALDTVLSTYGDILVPHKNWVRIVRAGYTVWQGAIIENTKRTKDYIEVVAAEPLWYLNKILINRTSVDPANGQSDGIYRIFSSGTMAAAVTSIINETITTFSTGSLTTTLNGTQTPTTTLVVNSTTGWPTSGQGTVNGYTFYYTGISGNTFTGVTGFNGGTYQNGATVFTIGDAGHALAAMTLGTVTNPNYPPNMTDGNNPPNKLSGGWNFGNGTAAPKLQFDFHTVLYVLKSMALYTYADFYLDNSLAFNFVPFKGNNLSNSVSFVYGGPSNPASNIIDYNLPRLGQRMVNDLYGIATDINGNVLHYDQTDQASIATYGLIQGVAAYSDVKDQATLNARIEAEVPLISAPDNAAISISLNEKGYPLGLYDVGDIVNINIKNKGLTFNDQRRVVGVTVNLNGTGREYVTVQTNKVLPFQFALAGGGNQTGVTT